MSNPSIPAAPLEGDDDYDAATTEVDGETRLDPDADEDLIDSADADRLASGDQSADVRQPSTQEDDPLRAALGDNGQGDLAPDDDPPTDHTGEPTDLRGDAS